MSTPKASMADPVALRQEILRLTREYSCQVHASTARHLIQIGGLGCQGAIPYAGRVFTEDEVEAAVSSTLDFWLTGQGGKALQRELAAFLGVRHSSGEFRIQCQSHRDLSAYFTQVARGQAHKAW